MRRFFNGQQEMGAKRRLGVMPLFVVLAKALLYAGAIMFLADYFGWHLLREAGGQIVRTTF